MGRKRSFILIDKELQLEKINIERKIFVESLHKDYRKFMLKAINNKKQTSVKFLVLLDTFIVTEI